MRLARCSLLVFLACLAFPLAIVGGLGVAIGAAWSSLAPYLAATSGDINSGTRLTVTWAPSTWRACASRRMAAACS